MNKPTVVLLHGVGLDHTTWAAVASLLRDDYDVVAPDLPGHGSRPPVDATVSLADLAEGVADDVPPGSHLVGFSLGALVAQHLAVHRPELVATLTSVSSVCRRTPAEREAVLQRLAVAERDFAASAAASVRRWYDGTTVSSSDVGRTERTLLGNDPASFLSCYRVFATGDADLAPRLADITAPSLAVTGEEDPGSTPEMTRRLAAAIPDCRAVVVPGARHMLPVERPRELVDCLTTFIGGEVHA
ncbi:alpha/beta fold hydrolase [Nocardioides sp. MAHUQ-72]|uniref:alpha/beta fold hydrolase n=1 Tax=unclassified Nocardioides TaxID=2615069 RepID=UPI00360FADBF